MFVGAETRRQIDEEIRIFILWEINNGYFRENTEARLTTSLTGQIGYQTAIN